MLINYIPVLSEAVNIRTEENGCTRSLEETIKQISFTLFAFLQFICKCISCVYWIHLEYVKSIVGMSKVLFVYEQIVNNLKPNGYVKVQHCRLNSHSLKGTLRYTIAKRGGKELLVNRS